jgi:hypothetical protein
MVPPVPYRFAASFQCFCLCMRLVAPAVSVSSKTLCIADQLYDRLGKCGKQPLTSGL